MSKLGLAIAGILSLSMFAVAAYLWMSLGDVEMSGTGIVALIGGGLATLGLGVGLMSLVFYSNRKGYDERAGGRAEPPPNE
jgi:formate hydrogenlyase subunit 3/multisubunit Na+/H+ antiporter MnhD subunit